MDQILDEEIQDKKSRIHCKEVFIKVCDKELEKYKDRWHTDNVYEAIQHEYWRTCKLMALDEINYHKYRLSEIEKNLRENKKRACWDQTQF